MKYRIGCGPGGKHRSWPDSSGMMLGEKVGEVREGGWAAEERGQSRHFNGRIIPENAHRNVVFIVGIFQNC